MVSRGKGGCCCEKGRGHLHPPPPLYTFLIFLFLYAPILVLIVFSFNDTETASRTVFSGFSLKWYQKLFEDRLILEALRNTLLIAVLSAAASTVLGTVAAIGIGSMKRLPKRIMMNITNFPMVNPEIVTGVSLMLLFVFAVGLFGGRSLGMGSLVTAHITFCLPYVILSVLPKLRQMDPNLYEAAQDLGCPPVKAFFKVVLPEIMPGVVTGMIMACPWWSTPWPGSGSARRSMPCLQCFSPW